MPKVLDIQPKEVHVTVEFSLTELLLLHEALNHAELHLNLEDEFHEKASQYVEHELFPFLSGFVEESKNGS